MYNEMYNRMKKVKEDFAKGTEGMGSEEWERYLWDLDIGTLKGMVGKQAGEQEESLARVIKSKELGEATAFDKGGSIWGSHPPRRTITPEDQKKAEDASPYVKDLGDIKRRLEAGEITAMQAAELGKAAAQKDNKREPVSVGESAPFPDEIQAQLRQEEFGHEIFCPNCDEMKPLEKFDRIDGPGPTQMICKDCGTDVNVEDVQESKKDLAAAGERTKKAQSLLRKIHKSVAMGDLDDAIDAVEKAAVKGDIDDKQASALKTASDRREKKVKAQESDPKPTEPSQSEDDEVKANEAVVMAQAPAPDDEGEGEDQYPFRKPGKQVASNESAYCGLQKRLSKVLEGEGVNDCLNFRRDTEQCRTGCKKEGVGRMDVCRHMDSQPTCACYRGPSEMYPKEPKGY